MFKHILKLIWKRRKVHFLMILEIFVSFLILFAVGSLGAYTYRNYANPPGLSIDNRWVVFLNFNTSNDTLMRQNTAMISTCLKGLPEVKSWSFSSGNLPFSFTTMNEGMKYNGKEAVSDFIRVQETFPEVMNIHLSSGRWFKAEDTIGRRQPVVITRHLAEALFGNEDPVGKRLTADDSLGMFVIGMTDFYRHKSSFQPNENCVFMAAGSGESSLVVHVAQGADAVFEAKLARSIQQLGKDWTVEIQHLDNMKANKDKIVLIPIIVLCVICGFLIINVALGLFGVLFQTISRRKGEIGIRRAMGATRGRILRQFVGETMMVTTLGILFGVFFAIQIPLLNLFDVEMIVYIWGIVLATVSVYGLTILCAYYPSRQASTIFPAAALHED